MDKQGRAPAQQFHKIAAQYGGADSVNAFGVAGGQYRLLITVDGDYADIQVLPLNEEKKGKK